MEMSDIKSMTQHHILVSRLHGIIRNAATHDQSMIHKLYAVMRRHGFINKNAIRNSLKTQTITSRQLLHKIKKVFKSESHSTTVSKMHYHTTTHRSSSTTTLNGAHVSTYKPKVTIVKKKKYIKPVKIVVKKAKKLHKRTVRRFHRRSFGKKKNGFLARWNAQKKKNYQRRTSRYSRRYLPILRYKKYRNVGGKRSYGIRNAKKLTASRRYK